VNKESPPRPEAGRAIEAIMKSNELMMSYSIRGIDGNDLSISETFERLAVLVIIRCEGRVATVRLNKDQYEALGEVMNKYGSKIEVNYPDEKLPDKETTNENAPI
jgi:hypothetical protein